MFHFGALEMCILFFTVRFLYCVDPESHNTMNQHKQYRTVQSGEQSKYSTICSTLQIVVQYTADCSAVQNCQQQHRSIRTGPRLSVE